MSGSNMNSRSKLIISALLVVILVLICGMVTSLVYFDVLDIPIIENIIVSVGLKNDANADGDFEVVPSDADESFNGETEVETQPPKKTVTSVPLGFKCDTINTTEVANRFLVFDMEPASNCALINEQGVVLFQTETDIERATILPFKEYYRVWMYQGMYLEDFYVNSLYDASLVGMASEVGFPADPEFFAEESEFPLDWSSSDKLFASEPRESPYFRFSMNEFTSPNGDDLRDVYVVAHDTDYSFLPFAVSPGLEVKPEDYDMSSREYTGKYGVILNGDVVLPFEYDNIRVNVTDDSTVFAVQKGGLWGFVDVTDGSMLTDFVYQDVTSVTANSAAATREGQLLRSDGFPEYEQPKRQWEILIFR